MNSVKVDPTIRSLKERTLSDEEYRRIHSQVMDLLTRGGSAGDFFFPFTNAQGHRQHDYNIQGQAFSMIQQDNGTWKYVES